MKTFFSSVGIVLAVLVIWAGCDTLFTPNSEDGLSDGDRGWAYSQVEPGVLAELEEAIRTVAVQWEGAVESNQACLSAPFSREDVDPLHDRLDQLLGQIDDGLTRENFPSRMAELDAADWERADSAAVNVLLEDYNALRAPYDAACPEDKEMQELANTIFAEYADVIRGLGVDGWHQLVDSVLPDEATGPCEDKCRKRFRNGVMKMAGMGAAMYAGCSALVFPFAAAVCYVGVTTWMIGERNDLQLDLHECLAACLTEDGPPAGIVPRNGNLDPKN